MFLTSGYLIQWMLCGVKELWKKVLDIQGTPEIISTDPGSLFPLEVFTPSVLSLETLKLVWMIKEELSIMSL